ncbi:unnamed protein product [Bursaphelenchus xylophilus]|nr:unnamed protein product [Bursaphelenchus xylophilus]CAG9131244.1 unnamed protein product [Bursaphelenchus xylophilus]
MLSGNNFIPYYLCYYINILMVQGITLSIFMTMFVGVDRLIGVTFPIIYTSISKVPYIGVCLAASISFAGYISWLGYGHTKSEFGREPVMCSIIDSMGAGSLPWFDACFIINLIDLLIYSIVWIQLRNKTSNNDSMRRVFKSLLVMMVVVVFGWLVNAFVRSVIIPYGEIPVSQWFFWASYGGLLVNIASTLNFFILFSFSSEYRTAFTSLLPFLKGFRSHSLLKMQSSNGLTKLEGKSKISTSTVKPVHTITVD